MDKILFKAIVGSQSFGTATPQSDVDNCGIYAQHPDKLLSFGYVEQINITKDEKYWELRRFMELLMAANPNALELLFCPVDMILLQHECWDILLEHRKSFLTKVCKESFTGYALAQVVKAKGLDKKMNWEKERTERKTVLDFCYVVVDGKTVNIKDFMQFHCIKQENCGLVKLNHFTNAYAIYFGSNYKGIADDNSNSVRLSSIPKGEKPLGTMCFNAEAYSKHCKEYREYQTWLKERNETRFIDVKGHNQQVDGKNLLHTRRLLNVAMEIAETGNLQVRRPFDECQFLLKIKKGEVPLEEIITKAEEDIKKLNDLYNKSGLPATIDKDFVNDILIEMRKKLRWQ